MKPKWVSCRAAEKTSSTAQDLPTFFPMECSSEHSGFVEADRLTRGFFFVIYIPFLCVCQTHFSSPAPRVFPCQFRTTSRSQIIRPHYPSSTNSASPPQSLIAGLPAISTFSIKHLYCSYANPARCNLIGHEFGYAALSRMTSIS